MNFELFYSDNFINIIKNVYKLKSLNTVDYSDSSKVPLFVSRLPFKSKLAFDLPFGFCQSGSYLKNNLDIQKWKNLSNYSKKTGINISLNTIGELPFLNGKIVSNNPILNIYESVDIFSNYSKSHQHNLRKERNKCSRYGVKVIESREVNDLKEFYNIMALQYVKNHKMVFQPYKLFANLFHIGKAKLFVAKHGSDILGGILCTCDSDTIHYNWGVRKNFKNLHIGTICIDYAIKKSISFGYRYFDFGLTPLSDTNLLNFKMKWGCINFPVYNYFTSSQVPYIDLNSSFPYLRKLYSLLSPNIAKLLMPIVIPILVC